MRVGILTGGGDAPGLNAAIRAVGTMTHARGGSVVQVRDGWKGLLGDGDLADLDQSAFEGILHVGGTILGSSRTNPMKIDGGVEQCLRTIEHAGLDALVAIGGDDTLSVARRLAAEGAPVVGCPKTMDNDLSVTEYCIGFDTAVGIVAEGVEMPELGGREDAGGERDAFGHVRLSKRGVGERLAEAIEERTGKETRSVSPSYIQRGGTPSAYDRIWATRCGTVSFALAEKGAFGLMPAVRCGKVDSVPIADVVAEQRLVPRELYEMTRAFR